MASGIWYRTTQIAREETRCRHIGYSFRLAAMVILYSSSHRQDNTYNGLCYTSRGTLAGTRLIVSHLCMNVLMFNYKKWDPQTQPDQVSRMLHVYLFVCLFVCVLVRACICVCFYLFLAISRSSKCFTTGVIKAVV